MYQVVTICKLVITNLASPLCTRVHHAFTFINIPASLSSAIRMFSVSAVSLDCIIVTALCMVTTYQQGLKYNLLCIEKNIWYTFGCQLSHTG